MEGRNMNMTVCLIDLTSDVLRYFTTFYSILFDFYTLTFVMLNCFIVIFLLVEFE